MAEKKIKSETPAPTVMIATQGFYDTRSRTQVYPGETVEVGHPLLRGRNAYFRPFAPTHSVPAKPESDAQPEVKHENPTREATPQEKAQATEDQKEVLEHADEIGEDGKFQGDPR